MIHTITTDVQFVAHFRGADERGDAVTAARIPGEMRALTPLAAMELYEQLHAARNDVRKQAGLAEIPTPDEGVLVLAFLRLLRDIPATTFRGVLERLDEAVRTMQQNRLEEATIPHRKGWPECPCPSCKGINDIRGLDERGAACRHCGADHTDREWMAAIFVPDANGAEVT